MIEEEVMPFIPLSVPHLDGNEWKYVKECLDTGWISSAGAYVNQFEQMVADYVGAKYGVACMNGTAGLHIAELLLDVKPGDHVIAPNITFIATLNAIKYAGASPILIDVDQSTWQMDLDLLEKFLEEETEDGDKCRVLKSKGSPVSGIMPVHVLGNMCNMERLMTIANKYSLIVIEDSTEALGSYYNGKSAGNFGKIGVFSFNGNKIISTGGGGVIVTDDENLANRARHLTTQAKISPSEYIHDEIGYNYRLVNVLAAIGVAQMEQLSDILQRKKKMDAYYRNELNGVGDITFQGVLGGCQPNNWLFTLRTKRMRELLESLNNSKIISRPFWMPMNQLPMFQEELYCQEKDVSNRIYQTAVSIPSSSNLTQEQMSRVTHHIKGFFN